jgi:Flp pilus assembly protein CpaB
MKAWWRVNKWLVATIIFVGAAVYAALTVLAATPPTTASTPPAAVHTAIVYVLRAPLADATQITAADLSAVAWPLNLIPPGALKSPPEGLWTAEALPAGVPLVSTDVINPATSDLVATHIPPGDVAMNLTLAASSEVDGVVVPGDRISILATVSASGRTGPETEWFLRHILVLAVNGDLAGTATPGAGESLILALTPQQALGLQFAETAGQLQVVLERPGESLPAVPPYGRSWPAAP